MCLVPLSGEGFYTGVVKLQPGDALVGAYKARRPGETPRKSVFAVNDGSRSKVQASHVDIVLYRADVLAEDNDRSTDADWEIISINARDTEAEQPISPGALIANHLQLDGGTATGMSAEEFVEKLRESVEYWGDRALLEPSE